MMAELRGRVGPAAAAMFSRFAPISQGLTAMRAVAIDGRTSFPLVGDGGILWTAGISATYVVIGIAAFGLGQRRALRRGSLGRY